VELPSALHCTAAHDPFSPLNPHVCPLICASENEAHPMLLPYHLLLLTVHCCWRFSSTCFCHTHSSVGVSCVRCTIQQGSAPSDRSILLNTNGKSAADCCCGCIVIQVSGLVYVCTTVAPCLKLSFNQLRTVTLNPIQTRIKCRLDLSLTVVVGWCRPMYSA